MKEIMDILNRLEKCGEIEADIMLLLAKEIRGLRYKMAREVLDEYKSRFAYGNPDTIMSVPLGMFDDWIDEQEEEDEDI